MTNIKITPNKIILNGHSSTVEECETATLLANALEKSTDFKSIKYEDGYAEFERIGTTKNLKFAPSRNGSIINWDSNIKSVTSNIPTWAFDLSNPPTKEYAEWTTNGETQGTGCQDGADYTFTITLNDGYVLDSITYSEQEENNAKVINKTDNTFTMRAGVEGIGGTITLTSKVGGGADMSDKQYLDEAGLQQLAIKTKEYMEKRSPYIISNMTTDADGGSITIEPISGGG